MSMRAKRSDAWSVPVLKKKYIALDSTSSRRTVHCMNNGRFHRTPHKHLHLVYPTHSPLIHLTHSGPRVLGWSSGGPRLSQRRLLRIERPLRNGRYSL